MVTIFVILFNYVQGPTWQFKGWKWNGNPVEIFSQVPAFHLYYEDLEVS